MTEQDGQEDNQPTGTLIRVNHGSRYTWHHSVRFDGIEHETACGMAVDTDDIETVIMDVDEFQDVDGRECCDECAGSVRAVINDWRGLHEKYEVYEDGDRVENCFVLEPASDQAARAALIEYAEQTDNEDLAQDLRDWVVDICTEDEQLVTDGGEEVGRATRQKTEFWGYDQHERSLRDVTDDERWQTELEWALDESLAYARMVESPETAISANHCVQRNFMGHFEAMLNDLLHKPLDLCTATETVQQTEQATLGGGTVAE